MKPVIAILIIFLLFIQSSSAQKTSYKDSVITLLKQIRKGNKVYNDHDNEAKRKYFYHKATGKIVAIVIAPNKSHSAFQYDFINNELVVIKLYLPYTLKLVAAEKMNAVFFFKNNILVEKEEVNIPQIDIEQFKIQAYELFNQATQFLEKKGVR